ncbi:MAG TPA: heme-binding protein, partial [Methanoregula sp.]|nr:heme-binding protein [Methanoregula sp.]
MRTVIMGIGALAVILLPALLLSRSSAGSIPYTDRGKAGEIEFRHYPELVLATVDTAKDDAGFNLLFAYISGSNKHREKIPMTAPVVSDAGSMSFVMPAGTTREETPDPLDSRVRIVTQPERDIAVIRFSGYAPLEDVDAVTSRLQDGLKNEGIGTAGRPFLMRYDSPWTPGFMRRNEVGIEIRR